MQRAVYSPEEEGHYALASDCYCHFTSPIRRYPDLTIHRLIDAIARGKQAAATTSTNWSSSASIARDREQRAEAAERELTKLKLLAYLSDRIGEEMDAVITGVESFGLFVQGIELPAEGLDPHRLAGRRLLPLRPRHAHARRPPLRQHLPAGRPGARGRRPGRSGTPRAGFPPGRSQASGRATNEASRAAAQEAGQAAAIVAARHRIGAGTTLLPSRVDRTARTSRQRRPDPRLHQTATSSPSP